MWQRGEKLVNTRVCCMANMRLVSVTEIDIRASATFAAQNLGYRTLIDLHMEVILAFATGHDVFAVLLTGFGKTLCYACLKSQVHEDSTHLAQQPRLIQYLDSFYFLVYTWGLLHSLSSEHVQSAIDTFFTQHHSYSTWYIIAKILIATCTLSDQHPLIHDVISLPPYQ